jgi:hypothetical protein
MFLSNSLLLHRLYFLKNILLCPTCSRSTRCIVGLSITRCRAPRDPRPRAQPRRRWGCGVGPECEKEGYIMALKKDLEATTSIVATVSLVCLLDSHQVKHLDNVRFLVNLENYGVSPPDVHSIDLHFRMQAFYVRCVERTF